MQNHIVSPLTSSSTHIVARLFIPRCVKTAWFLTADEKATWLEALAETGSAPPPPPSQGQEQQQQDGGGKTAAAASSAGGDWAALKAALSSRVVYCAGLWRALYATALYAVMYFSPLIIKAMFASQKPDASRVALLTAVPFAGGAVAHALNALHSSRTGERRAHIAAPWICAGLVMATVPAALQNGASAAAFALFAVASTAVNSADGPDISWVTSLLGPQERALGLAAVNMFANVGGFVGPYVIGALSTAANGSFNGGLWFVSGVIFLAGAAVAAFPLRWAGHNDAPVIAARASSSLELRRASRLMTMTVAEARGVGGGAGGARSCGGASPSAPPIAASAPAPV